MLLSTTIYRRCSALHIAIKSLFNIFFIYFFTITHTANNLCRYHWNVPIYKSIYLSSLFKTWNVIYVCVVCIYVIYKRIPETMKHFHDLSVCVNFPQSNPIVMWSQCILLCLFTRNKYVKVFQLKYQSIPWNYRMKCS